MKQLVVKPGREKSLLRRHPWLFSGAIARAEGNPDSGDTVAVRSGSGEFLAWAAYSPASQIRARVWSWNEDEKIDSGFLQERLRRAHAARAWVRSRYSRECMLDSMDAVFREVTAWNCPISGGV